MGDRRRVFVAVLRSAALRRVGLAFLSFSVSEWATWVALVVYAYGRGGAPEAGLVAAASLAPSLLVAPLASVLGDRYPRRLVLVGAYATQGLAMTLTAASLALGGPPLLVYALSAVAATSITLTRPLQASLLPEIVTTPDELTAANVASGTVESTGTLAGPIVASVLVGLGGPGLVFAACGAAMLASAAALVPLARSTPVVPRRTPEGALPGPAAVGAELVAGLAAIAADRRLLAVALASAAGWLLIGSLDIFYAVLAIDVLGMGEAGVGLLGAATGIGALAGSAVSLGLVGRRGLATPLVGAAAVFGLAVLAVGLVATPLAVAALLAVAGTAYTVLYVSGQTYTQRIAPPAALTRVFGVFEAALMGMTALGALVVPALVAFAGPAGALALAGSVLPVVALLVLRPLRAADRTLVVPERELRLLAGVPMFAVLAAPVLERLARSLVPLRLPAGAAVIREGEPGDRFYVIATGRVEVTIGGRQVRVEGPGESFGEIALLRAMPRTATVTALEDAELYALDREPFLEAVTGQPRSHATAAAVVEERLATSG